MDEYQFLITGLNNAYAMEVGIETALRGMANDLKGFPEFQKGVKNHISVTRAQAKAVYQRIRELGGNVSNVKKIVSQFMSKMQGLSMKMMPYKSLKNLSIAYATEYMEIATYKQLEIIADRINDKETARLCRNLMVQEAAMAKEIEKLIPLVTEREMRDSIG